MVHAVDIEGSKITPLCRWKKGVGDNSFKREPYTSTRLQDTEVYARKFCKQCKSFLIASAQLEVESRFDTWGGTPQEF